MRNKKCRSSTLRGIANKLCDLYEKNYMSVHIDDRGRITNWKTLAPITKEDLLEDEHNDVDYSHSKYKYPALHQYHRQH